LKGNLATRNKEKTGIFEMGVEIGKGEKKLQKSEDVRRKGSHFFMLWGKVFDIRTVKGRGEEWKTREGSNLRQLSGKVIQKSSPASSGKTKMEK